MIVTIMNVKAGIEYLVQQLKMAQSPRGTWEYPFETGISTDAYMIILLRTLEINDEELIRELTNRILNRQQENGAWKLFEDEGAGNITTTTEAYYSLLFSGYYKSGHPKLEQAKRFILANGGLSKVHMFTQILLCITGQMKWPSFFPIPVEIMLLPTSVPVNFYSFSVFGRANICPIMVLADKKFSVRTDKSPDLTHLLIKRESSKNQDELDFNTSQKWRNLGLLIDQGLKSLIGVPKRMKKLATQKAKQYMLERIEPDGTFLNYFSSTFLLIFALLALGYPKNDPIITKAISGLLKMRTKIDGHTHMQYTTATVWNTALISTALQEAGVQPQDPAVLRANQYLLSQQHSKFGDWQIHNLQGKPGGWGFSDQNTINPDVDDTTAALRALAKSVRSKREARFAWLKGIQWLVTMQNNDGGWPSFERNVNQPWLYLLPIEKADFLVTDPSTPDLTGRTLQFFGDYTNLNANHPIISRAVRYLFEQQEKDGSWYGRWGICYLYGTWAALTGLAAVGVTSQHPSVRKAVKWLEEQQNQDGGWGESCNSDIKKRFVSLNESTLTNTAWAVDALIATSSTPSKAITAGIHYLLKHLKKNDWTTTYPNGQGMAGGFYIHYHSYRNIFPLLTLAHYRNKYK